MSLSMEGLSWEQRILRVLGDSLVGFPLKLLNCCNACFLETTYHNNIISHTTRTVKLIGYEEKTILVKRAKTGADVSNYDEIIVLVIHSLFILSFNKNLLSIPLPMPCKSV